LFQFIDQTWLTTIKELGPSLGYGRYANAIVKSDGGAYAVPDASMRTQIMSLRNDPTTNAVMAGAFTKNNAAVLNDQLGRPASEGELYIAHFLGANGASKLIEAAANRPDSNAVAAFPNASRANRSIFYTPQGRPRSALEVYGVLVSRYDAARAAPPGPPLPLTPPTASSAASAARVADAFSTIAAANAAAPPVDNTPIFQALFRTERQEAVAPAIGALWGAQAASGSAADQPSSSPIRGPAERGGMLDLFQDPKAGTARPANDVAG
jgi:hypothetical protein